MTKPDCEHVHKMQSKTMAPATSQSDRTKQTILSAAIGVFQTYGYKKTSLNDVACMANVSRQTLYLLFKDKQGLFRAAIDFDLGRNLATAKDMLSTAKTPQAALLEAFFAWHGQFVEQGKHLKTDFLSAAFAHGGDIMAKREQEFFRATEARLESLIRYPDELLKVSIIEMVEIVNTLSVGLKVTTAKQSTYRKKLLTALRAFMGPVSAG